MTFTQDGPLLTDMKRYALEHQLECDFLGLVPMEELLALYQSCTLFLAPGRAEPWGLRVNDALHCGAPVVVSTGMGVSEIVREYGCGAVFEQNNHVDLAKRIAELLSEPDRYKAAIKGVKEASKGILPSEAAKRVSTEVSNLNSLWTVNE